MKKLTLGAVLTALAFALSFAERMIPLELVIPVPGIKLGLANTVSMFAIFYLEFPYALCILIGRCALSFFLFGSFTAFCFSVTGGLISLVVMKLLAPLVGKCFSLLGVSIAGAASHNTGQILAAMALLGQVEVAGYLPLLLVSAIPFGLITGYVAMLLFERLDKAHLFRQ